MLLTKTGEIPRAQIGAAPAVREALRLRTPDIWKNLLVMVGLPYLKRKLDESYDIHVVPQSSSLLGGPRYNPRNDLPPNPTIRQRFMFYYKWFLRNVYPSVNAAYYFSILAFNLAYLFDNTKYSSPFLWLIGTRIRRLGSADQHAIAMAMQPKPGGSNQNQRPGSGMLGFLSPQNIYPQLLQSLRFFLPASIFALKFLEWWHASDFSRQLARKVTETLDLPAPVVTGMLDPSVRKANSTQKPTQKPSPTSSSSLKPALKSTISSSSRQQPPISSTSYLPIFTVPLPAPDSDNAGACPICLNPLTNPTACQTGYVFCYGCVFRWLNGEHERQIDFMNGVDGGAAWDDDVIDDDNNSSSSGDPSTDKEQTGGQEKSHADSDNPHSESNRSREGKWESGKGRCPVTGRRVLGGTDCLRRVLV